MTFPLERHPGSIVFVDDDETYLSVIRSIFPATWNILTFVDACEFVDHIAAKNAAAKEMAAYQRGAIDRYKKGASLASEVVRFWNAFPERYSLPQVVIIDYHMPTLNGLEALGLLQDWGGQKILLTGVADEASVCQALNERRIHYYIAKQNARLIDQTVTTVKMMLNNYAGTAAHRWNVWQLSMRTEQELLLQNPHVTKALFDFVGEVNEHVVLGDPFGVMSLGHNGGVKWFQIETTTSLSTAASIAQNMGAEADLVDAIREGSVISDARICSALGLLKPPSTHTKPLEIYIPQINETLYGGAFELDVPTAPPPEMCYSTWLARQHRT